MIGSYELTGELLGQELPHEEEAVAATCASG
jgi:hypothetical protein